MTKDMVRDRCNSVLELLMIDPLDADVWSDIVSDLKAAHAIAEAEADRLALLEEAE